MLGQLRFSSRVKKKLKTGNNNSQDDRNLFNRRDGDNGRNNGNYYWSANGDLKLTYSSDTPVKVSLIPNGKV